MNRQTFTSRKQTEARLLERYNLFLRILLLFAFCIAISLRAYAIGGFLPTGNMASARFRHTSTLLPDGRVLVAGGLSPCCPTLTLSSAELYDPVSGTFSPSANMSDWREFGTATLLPNGKVLMIGGSTGDLFDPNTGVFSPTPSLLTPRSGHTATLLPNGKVLLAGGYFNRVLASAELYDPPSGTFSSAGNMTTGRYFHSATLLPDGRVLLTGGFDSSRTAEIYDPASGTFASTSNMKSPRNFHTTTLLQNGKVLVAGGNGDDPSAELYDSTTGTFSLTAPMHFPRGRHRATLLTDGKVLITGGVVGAEVYDPTTELFQSAGVIGRGVLDPGSPLNDATATLLQNGQILVCGGEGWIPNDSILERAELWNSAIVSPPTIFYTDPSSATQNGSSFTLAINGSEFSNGSILLWNAVPRSTTFYNDWQLTAQIDAGDLVSDAEFYSTTSVTVRNPDGQVSNPATFTVFNPNVLGATVVSVDPGAFRFSYVDGYSPAQHTVFGMHFGISDQGPDPLTVTAAIYGNNPTAPPLPDIGAGYYAFRVPGATELDSADPQFEFSARPFFDRGADPYSMSLLYFNGAKWGPVLGSGGSAPNLNIDERDGNPGSSYFYVLFDATSTPKITELGNSLNNTVFTFGFLDTTPPIISCPSDIVVTASSGDSTAVVPFEVTATDDGPYVAVISSPASGFLFPVGTTTVNSTATDAFGNSTSCLFTVTVNPPAPILSSLSPATKVGGSPAFTLAVNGSDFRSGAVVLWNGSNRPTAFISSSQLTASIPASDLTGGSDISTVFVTVRNPNGALSNPESFTITPANVSAVQSTAADAGEQVVVSTAPIAPGQTGVTATVNNTGGDPVGVTVANYSSNPSGTAFSAGGGFTDVQITGADPADTATVNFYYPSNIDPATEVALTLVYFNGSSWIAVRSSGSTDPVKNTSNNLDGTISGGGFAVVFSSTSTPKITELSGTVFAAADAAPAITSITTPAAPTPVAQPLALNVLYSATSAPASHRVTINWGDGQATVITPAVSGIANSSHSYSAPGVYTATVTLNDGTHPTIQAVSQYIVVYDPNGGFVTGGGSINSPAGAFPSKPALTGKATFGFVAKYKKGASIPDGNTEFQFQVANFNFSSTAYDWLVVSGSKAQYKGTGTVNNTGNYKFLLTAIDGDLKGGNGVDKFRIKVWDSSTGTVVYDNQFGASDGADPSTQIAGGSIVIHAQ
jgi:hypothetical protein